MHNNLFVILFNQQGVVLCLLLNSVPFRFIIKSIAFHLMKHVIKAVSLRELNQSFIIAHINAKSVAIDFINSEID